MSFRTTPNNRVTATVYGRTSTIDPGSRQRIIDVVGQISLSGKLGPTVILSSVAQAELVYDGISGFDYDNNEVFFASDGAFGGTVFFGNMTDLTTNPPASYYLTPVGFLGYDHVSGSRIISGVNTPTKNFLVMEQAFWGNIQYFLMPPGVSPGGFDGYDGNSKSYYSPRASSLIVWSLQYNNVTAIPLSCIPSGNYIAGAIHISPSDPNTLFALVSDRTQAYKFVTINVKGQSCTLSAPLVGLPPKPIVVASEIGPMSGFLYLSSTSNSGNNIAVFNTQFSMVNNIKVGFVFEDIFVAEN